MASTAASSKRVVLRLLMFCFCGCVCLYVSVCVCLCVEKRKGLCGPCFVM